MKEKVNCHVCGWSRKIESGSVITCPVCSTNIINKQEETVQKSDGCAYAIKKNAMMKPGKFIMTNKRFLWVKDNGTSDDLNYAAGGILGVLLGRWLVKNDELHINIPLNELTSVEKTTKGMEMLIIKDKNGVIHNLRIANLNEWHEIFLNTIEKNKGTK